MNKHFKKITLKKSSYDNNYCNHKRPGFLKLGFSKKKVSFAELKENISIMYAKEALLKCNMIARKTGLSKMTHKELYAEIKAARKDAKDRS